MNDKLEAILQGLAKISPVIGGAIAGPAGAALGTAVKATAEILTGKSDPDEILAELTADPNKLLELEQRTREFEVETLRIHAADRASARQMQQSLAASGSGTQWSSSIISVIVTVGFFWMLAEVMDSTTEVNEIAYILLGTLGGGFSQVVSYWLGSSKGSSEKTAMLAKKAGL